MSTAKSFTQWSTYDKCPRKYRYRYRDHLPRIVTDKNEAAERGTRIHESVEDLFNVKREDVDEEIQDTYGEWLCSIRDAYEYKPEFRFALNREFEPCDYKDEDCIVRGFIDLVVFPDEDTVAAYEWKSGKEYPEHMHQKMLYGMSLLIAFPKTKEVKVTGVYFDQGMNRPIVYKREMLPTYKWMWLRRFDTMDADETCAPNPTYLCNWCDYSKDKGGPCSF